MSRSLRDCNFAAPLHEQLERECRDDCRIRSDTERERRRPDAGGLKKGAIGIVAVLFMAVANAAPITAMTSNTPIAVGFGDGIGAPQVFSSPRSS